MKSYYIFKYYFIVLNTCAYHFFYTFYTVVYICILMHPFPYVYILSIFLHNFLIVAHHSILVLNCVYWCIPLHYFAYCCTMIPVLELAHALEITLKSPLSYLKCNLYTSGLHSFIVIIIMIIVVINFIIIVYVSIINIILRCHKLVELREMVERQKEISQADGR